MTTVQHSGNPGELDHDDERGHCDICSQQINGPDLCATDVDLGTCHAACLEGSPVVNLDTGEPMPEGAAIHTYRLDGLPIAKPLGTTIDCICVTTGNGSEGCGLCNETGARTTGLGVALGPLSGAETKVLQTMDREWGQDFGCRASRDIADDAEMPADLCKAVLTVLRLRGLVELHKGLLNEEGRAFGSGWQISDEGHAIVQPLKTDEGGCVTKRFVIFTRPGMAPEKKGGWLQDEHLIEFLREVMIHDGWVPGFRATVLELTWDNDLWASSASEYLSTHDHAIGPRRARKAWREAREKHERIYKSAPSMPLGQEIATYHRLTAPPVPTRDDDKLREAVALAEYVCGLLPSLAGAADQPDNKVYAAYVNKREIMGARDRLAALKSPAAQEGGSL